MSKVSNRLFIKISNEEFKRQWDEIFGKHKRDEIATDHGPGTTEQTIITGEEKNNEKKSRCRVDI